MADGMYVAMTGAVARLRQLDSISDNLANAQTPGFKASRPTFESFLPAGNPGSQKVSTAAVATALDLSAGTTVNTGNPLDLLPTKDAFLAVQTPDGTAYTRNGRVTVGDDDYLYVADHLLLDNQEQPISIPRNATIEVQQNGELIVNGQRSGQIGRYTLSGDVDRVSGTLLVLGKGGAAAPSDATIQVGAMETGNASALESTVELINAQRHFDSAMQAIQTYRRMDEKATEIGKVR